MDDKLLEQILAIRDVSCNNGDKDFEKFLFSFYTIMLLVDGKEATAKCLEERLEQCSNCLTNAKHKRMATCLATN
jgi:hypothetical protein